MQTPFRILQQFWNFEWLCLYYGLEKYVKSFIWEVTGSAMHSQAPLCGKDEREAGQA